MKYLVSTIDNRPQIWSFMNRGARSELRKLIRGRKDIGHRIRFSRGILFRGEGIV
jgi:hypothetical protein